MMGKYTVLDDTSVDETVEDHLRQIVAAIRSRIEPRAIILRGSFSQGEGSVVVERDSLRFLSDYELVAVTPHYGHRRWLRTVAQEMTAQLGVETSISRVHPYNMERRGMGNLPIGGIARPTIATYELYTGGRTLYGESLLNQRAEIDPSRLDIWDGFRLMLNRMAESLNHVSQLNRDWETVYWINKTVLSCAEALLIVHGRYHFSYAERGRRFIDLVPELDTVLERASHLPGLVHRAIDFKLRPSLALYSQPMPLIWQQVQQACDATLRYVVEKYLDFSFHSYAEFPARYLSQLQVKNKLGKSRLWPLPAPLSQNLFLALRFLRARRRPPLGLIADATYPAYQIVFSVVPLMFLGSGEEVLQEARRWLGKVSQLEARQAENRAEWSHLRSRTVRAWKDLCYGMWNAI